MEEDTTSVLNKRPSESGHEGWILRLLTHGTHSRDNNVEEDTASVLSARLSLDTRGGYFVYSLMVPT